MADNIGAAFVEIAARGMENVQKAFAAVQGYVQAAAKAVTVPVKADTTNANSALTTLRASVIAISKAVTIPISVVTRGAVAAIGVLRTSISSLTGLAGSVAGSVASSIAGLGPVFDKMASVARTAFLSIAAAVGTFVAAASPGDMLEFRTVLAQLSVQIGTIFIPILRSVTATLQSVLDWFRKLSPEARASIEWWTTLALKVSAAVVVFVSVVKVIGTIASVVAVATASLSGLGIVVAAVVAGLSALFGMGGGDFGKIGESLTQFVSSIPDLLYKAFEPIGAIAAEAFNKLLEIWNQLAPYLQQIWSSVLETLEPFIASVSGLFSTFFEVFGSAFAIISTVAVQVAAVFKSLIAAVTPWIHYVATTLRPVFEFLGKIVITLSDAIKYVVNTIIDAVNGLSRFISDWTGIQLGMIKRLEYSAAQQQKTEAKLPANAQDIVKSNEIKALMTDAEKTKRNEEIKDVMRIPVKPDIAANPQENEFHSMQPWMMAWKKMQEEVWEKEDKNIKERARLNALPPKLQLEELKRQLVQVEGQTPKLAPQKPELFGIADAMKKAQQATQGISPEFAQRQEQQKLIEAGNVQRADLIKKIEILTEQIKKEMSLPPRMG
jgi:hypothetical protein